jgi:acetate kinase
MKIVVFNSGSSTLKFDLLDMAPEGDGQAGRLLARGLVDRIGGDSSVDFKATSGESDRRQLSVKDHHAAVSEAFAWLRSLKLDADINAAGHRVVQGGSVFVEPVLINDSVITRLDELSELAPLHNPGAIQGIRAAREVLGPDIPMVAVFDTAFHATLPDYAYTYALPAELAKRHKVRRYGFHGIAHEYMLRRYSARSGVPVDQSTIITLQLGNGCSMAAIQNGRSVDTSMGFTPLEGLVMGTRAGDIDASVPGYLAEKEGVSIEQVDLWLNKESGLLGVSERSSDMRDLLSAQSQDPRAALAVEMFCYRARKYIGAYMAAMGGAQAVVFGGGIGEHSAEIRARSCEGLQFAGLQLDPGRNEANTGGEELISTDGSKIAVYVVPVDESVLIAQYTEETVSRRG